MKIVICGSINFTPKIKEIADVLINQGHDVDIPLTSQRIINGEITLEGFVAEKNKNGDSNFRESTQIKMNDDVIKRYYKKIGDSDVILVVNIDKQNIANYIGGNTFLEMGFAYVLNKQIYLYNSIPEMPYTDELNAMQPIVIDGDLSKIQNR